MRSYKILNSSSVVQNTLETITPVSLPYTATEDCFVQYTVICKGTSVNDQNDYAYINATIFKNGQSIDVKNTGCPYGDYRGAELLRLVGVAKLKSGDTLSVTTSVNGGNVGTSWTGSYNKFILAD